MSTDAIIWKQVKDIQKFEKLDMHRLYKIFVFNYKANASIYLCKIARVYKTLEYFYYWLYYILSKKTVYINRLKDKLLKHKKIKFIF